MSVHTVTVWSPLPPTLPSSRGYHRSLVSDWTSFLPDTPGTSRRSDSPPWSGVGCVVPGDDEGVGRLDPPLPPLTVVGGSGSRSRVVPDRSDRDLRNVTSQCLRSTSYVPLGWRTVNRTVTVSLTPGRSYATGNRHGSDPSDCECRADDDGTRRTSRRHTNTPPPSVCPSEDGSPRFARTGRCRRPVFSGPDLGV